MSYNRNKTNRTDSSGGGTQIPDVRFQIPDEDNCVRQPPSGSNNNSSSSSRTSSLGGVKYYSLCPPGVDSGAEDLDDTTNRNNQCDGPGPPNDHRRLRVEFSGMDDEDNSSSHPHIKRSYRKNTDYTPGSDSRFRRAKAGIGVGAGNRLTAPRMSLLGKPLNYRAHKRDARYRRIQSKVYNFLERPKDWRAISYHLLV